MTLTLNIAVDPEQADAEYREKQRHAADALLDAELISPEQAAALTGSAQAVPANPVPANPVPLPQGSPEWKAFLYSIGAGRTGVVLSDEATSRESIYGDDGR